MIELKDKLPFWLSGPETLRLAAASEAFWARVETWLTETLAQADIAGCSSAALAAHARDRSVARLPGESEALWRLRVLHAMVTAKESGSRAGLEAILDAYGVTGYSILERQPDNDWDTVEVRLDPDALNGANSTLLDRIFHEWGRVCRRYLITHVTPAPLYANAAPVDELQHVEVAA